MTHPQMPNVGASVRQRLLNLARARREDFGHVLTSYAIERLLARLAHSPYATQFVLKGAQLFPLWMETAHRLTRDVDLLRHGDASVPRLEAIFRQVCGMSAPGTPDGIVFDPATVHGIPIREDAVYEGVRVTIGFVLTSARDTVQVDVGTGDAVIPAPLPAEMPSILGFPPYRLLTYPRDVVVAEKLEAMVALGIRNSRMKDFYDIWVLARTFAFDGAMLGRAVAATFACRQTPIPDTPPLALTASFSRDADKQVQWRAFLRRIGHDTTVPDLHAVVMDLHGFLMPVLSALAHRDDMPADWPPGGGWR